MTTKLEGIVATDTSAGAADGYAIPLLNAGGKLDISFFSGDLAALEALASTGIVVRTADGTFALRTLTAPAAGFTITNPAGIAGNPTFVLANDLSAIEALASTGIAVRTATDTWITRTLTAPGAGITISNANGVSGNPTFALANDLGAVEGLGTTGIVRRTGVDTWSAGTLVTHAEMETVATSRIIGRQSLGTGAREALTGTQVTAMLDVATSGAKGLVPATGGGTTNYLRADLTFANPIASIPTLAHGTYTPTLANIANGNVLTASVCQYHRVGSVVTVSGKFNASVTTGTTQTVISLTLPIASALANDNECGGAGGGYNATAVIPLYVNAEPTNNVARVIFVPPNTTARDYWFSFTYRII